MTPATKRIVGLLIACGIAFAMVALIDHIALSSVPLESGGHVASGAELKAAMEAGQLPFNFQLLILGGWLVAAYVGGTVAYRLSGQQGPALLFALIFTLATLRLLVEGSHPVWMWIGGLGGVPLIAMGAARKSITLRTG